MEFIAIQFLNGASFGMLLFLVAAGFTITYGLMRFLNLAHGSFYALGGYIGYGIARYTGNFFLGIVAGAVAIGILGMLLQYGLFQRNFAQRPSAQVLLTFGLIFIIADLTLWGWGGFVVTVPKPEIFKPSIHLGGIVFPLYRLVVLMIGLIVAAFLWWFQERTKYGAIVRAGVNDREMSKGIGINITRVNVLVFGMGALLAGLGGVIGGPFIGLYRNIEFETLLLAMVVVIIGGVGSLKGAFVGALIIGLAYAFGSALVPELSMFIIFGTMALVLAIKPTGLFGR